MSNWLSAWKIAFIAVLAATAAQTDGEASGREPTTFLSFHVEAESVEEGKMVERIRLGNRDYFFRKAPEFTNDHIEAFSPFPAENGKSWGAAFKMNKVGTQRLAIVTEGNLDRRLLTAVNQAPISFVIIDTAIRDGVIVVWSGLTEKHIDLFSKSLKRVDMQARDGNGDQDQGAANQPVPEEKPKKRRRLFGRWKKKEQPPAGGGGNPSDFADDLAPVPR